jgi:hypothetical protein
MFKSIDYLGSIGRDIDAIRRYEYRITDDDFTTTIILEEDGPSADISISAIIQEYSNRKLNVAANVIRYLQWYEKRYDTSVADHLIWAEKYQPPILTPELKTELEKYLTLI